MPIHNLVGIDIFSGAGGMSIGALMAGIDVKIAIEKDKYAAATFAFNHPNTEVIVDDISNVNIEKIKDINPFILFGGPPCQGFSTSNTKTRNDNNPNNSLFEEFLRFVKEIKPQWVIFENVEGFSKYGKGSVVKELENRFSSLGYKSKTAILWASDYFVPQKRNRFFLVANNLNLDFNFPEPNVQKVTVEEAIYDLPILENGENKEISEYRSNNLNDYTKIVRGQNKFASQNFVSRNKDFVIDRYKHIKQGQNWKAIPEKLMSNYTEVNNTHSGIYKRLDASKPSVVISNYRKNMLIHPFEDRGLSVREAARLQSFPDDFIFKGSLSHIQQQIGNAVPPLLAKAIFERIIKTTNG